MAKTYSLWKVQEYAKRLETLRKAYNESSELGPEVRGMEKGLNKALELLEQDFGPEAMEKVKEGKE